MIQTMLFVAGINTLLQTWFGTRLPVVIGGSFRFIIPMLYIALSQRYSFYFDPRVVCSYVNQILFLIFGRLYVYDITIIVYNCEKFKFIL